LSFCTFSFGHYVVCSSSIYWFWLPLWYLQTILNVIRYLFEKVPAPQFWRLKDNFPIFSHLHTRLKWTCLRFTASVNIVMHFTPYWWLWYNSNYVGCIVHKLLTSECVTRSLVLCVCFVDRCLSFCTFSFGHYVVCSSSIYWFWLPLWYLQTILNDSVLFCIFSNRYRITLRIVCRYQSGNQNQYIA
jgi:hypothetical protein